MAIIANTQPSNATTIAGPLSVVADQNLQPGSLTVANLSTLGGVAGGVLGAGTLTNAATITNNGTIAAPGSSIRVVRIQATAACTSAAIATGTLDGQDLTLLNAGATAITISTNVNAATTLAATGAAGFSWDAGLSLWFHKV